MKRQTPAKLRNKLKTVLSGGDPWRHTSHLSTLTTQQLIELLGTKLHPWQQRAISREISRRANNLT